MLFCPSVYYVEDKNQSNVTLIDIAAIINDTRIYKNTFPCEECRYWLCITRNHELIHSNMPSLINNTLKIAYDIV